MRCKLSTNNEKKNTLSLTICYHSVPKRLYHFEWKENWKLLKYIYFVRKELRVENRRIKMPEERDREKKQTARTKLQNV